MPDPREVRRELGLTQRELADRIGVTVKAVQHWEQGIRQPSGSSERALESLIEQK